MPPTIFGNSRNLEIEYPVIIRSGLNARKKSLPALSLLVFSRVSFTRPFVVPTGTVVSRTTRSFFLRPFPIEVNADTIALKSGFFLWSMNNGTMTIWTFDCLAADSASDVAMRFSPMCSWISPERPGSSGIGFFPLLIIRTVFLLMSTPVTLIPESAITAAKGRPALPSPITSGLHFE